MGSSERLDDALNASGVDLAVEIIPFARPTPEFAREWDDLARMPLHPNPFYTQAALDALIEADPTARADLSLICLRITTGPQAGRLVGLMPIRTRGAKIGWRRGAANYTSPYLPCGTPLIARNAPPGWAPALIGALTDGNCPAILRHLPLDGAFGEALRAALDASGANWRAIDSFARPIARRAQSYDAFARRAYGRSRRKGLKRLRNALGAQEPLAVESSTDAKDCADAVETFLAIEAAGWKGASGTALACEQTTRKMLARLFDRDLPTGGRRVDRLRHGDATIAISMGLVQDGTAFLWKTAYDERLRRLAPGIVLEDAIVRALHEEPGLAALDSCTLAPSPLEDLYDERLTIADIVIAPGRGGDALIAAEQGLRSLRRRVAGWLRRRRG